LPGLHEIEIEIRSELKKVEHLIQHLPMLGGDAKARFYFYVRP
jgi:hypothetical protein